MKVWQAILDELESGKNAALLYVVQSQGSSPGRQGFKMMVSQGGSMKGSIGGGAMEHKLVELAKSKLNQVSKPFIKQQFHRDDANIDRSGMICSGEQIVTFYFLTPDAIVTVKAILRSLQQNRKGTLVLTEADLKYNETETLNEPFSFELTHPNWIYKQQLGYQNTVFIIGAGHVGLALSKLMVQLGFYVVVLDDRDDLNTMIGDKHAHNCRVINYEKISTNIDEGPNSFVVIMTFGYRPDKFVLKQLLDKNFKYVGMMGSEAKVKQLMKELLAEGFNKVDLDKVHSPIGVTIGSQTPEEIAISVAAEIIAVKNK